MISDCKWSMRKINALEFCEIRYKNITDTSSVTFMQYLISVSLPAYGIFES